MGDWLQLDGAVCAVTGAGSGIGREICLQLAAAGARVAALDLTGDGLDGTAERVRAIGGTVLGVRCDVADEDAVAAAATEVHGALGGCDVLVNNAGTARTEALETIALADWRRPFDVNVTGALLCSRAFGAPMLHRGAGSVVHTGSISAGHPIGNGGGYSTSKSALGMLSRQLAVEWGPRGVRSNVVSPGLVRTPLSEQHYRAPGAAEARAAAVPLRRIGDVRDLADAVLFLASPRAAYVTGQEIVVDGGLSQGLMGGLPRSGG